MANHELTLQNFKNKSLLMHTSLENVLREELQKCVLFLLAEADFFREGVFQGGTALRIVYENIRYSEDLDFVFQSKNTRTFIHLESGIDSMPSKLKKWFPFLHIQKGKWQKQNEVLKRFQFSSTHESLLAKIMLQLEFANIPSYSSSITTIQWNMFPFPLRTESETEILVDKLVAFGLRSYLKGRDLWDLYFLLHIRKIELNQTELTRLVEQKSIDYGFSPIGFHSKFRHNLLLLKKEGLSILNNEMTRFMSQNIYTAHSQNFTSIHKLLIEDLTRFETWFSYEY